MPEQAQMEVRTVRGREIKLRWRPATHGEWLAWCYVPGPTMLPNDGVGFDARGPSPEAARDAVMEQVEQYLASSTSS
jgi:hypothetical protein